MPGVGLNELVRIKQPIMTKIAARRTNALRPKRYFFFMVRHLWRKMHGEKDLPIAVRSYFTNIIFAIGNVIGARESSPAC